MKEEIIAELTEIVGPEWVVTSLERMASYLTDETSNLAKPMPAQDLVLVKPVNAEQVSRVLKLANRLRLPVFPRGGGTGLVSGAIPTKDGIVLSLERMDRIEVDRDNMMAVAEAGVTLGKLLESAEGHGLAFLPHPGDEGAQVGGLVACNAGGSRALRQGVMRNAIKGLEVVFPTGEVLKFGGKLMKDNTGYPMMQLIIGSEGTLGVITKAVIRLSPKPKSSLTLIVPFDSRHEAVNAVPEILRQGVIPLAIEYVERDLILKSAEHLGEKWPAEGNVFLIFILAGNEDEVYAEAGTISRVCQESGSKEPLVAERREEQAAILKIRSNLYPVLKPDSLDILDATVPPSSIGQFADIVDEVAAKYKVHLPLFGHAGDGNLHCHVLRQDIAKYEDIKGEIYGAALRLGGVITGEHGIGKLRVAQLEELLPAKQMTLMREMKRIFDPNGILNPGTVLR